MIQIINKIKVHLKEHNNEIYVLVSDDLSLSTDLIEESIYDSMGFMELLAFLIDEFDKEINFDNIDADQITKISYLEKIFYE